MLLEQKLVGVPAQREIDADWSEYHHMSCKTRAAFGDAAIEVGTPDRDKNGDGWEGNRTDAMDTIANVLHHLRYDHPDEATDEALEELLRSAHFHFQHEATED